ncbi:MAG: Hint domain-containing protein [Pseudomonadota bacterium]
MASTISGTSGDDSLAGSSDDERIQGFAGDDTIDGGDGEDTLEGGDGADSIDGGRGPDSISGGDGADTIDGGSRADTIDAGSGADHVEGGSGDDSVDLGDGDDTFGSFDNDSGNDTIYGGAGNDYIVGGSGDDRVHGEDGDDTLVGGSGDDTVYGGAGSDVISITEDHGVDELYGGETGTDYDELRFHHWDIEQGVRVTFDGSGSGSYDFYGTSAAGTFAEFEQVTGTNQDDSIDASADSGGITLSGRGGDDTLIGGYGDDLIGGGSDDDSVDGGDGDDAIWGEDGQDTITGGTGDDTLSGGAGDDRFEIEDDADADTIDGGARSDIIAFSEAQSNQGVEVVFDGTGSGDYTFYGGSASGEFVSIEGIEGTDHADSVDARSDAGGVTVDGGAGDDTLRGGTDDDSISGGSGHDSVELGDGDDTFGDFGTDAGDDTIYGGGGDDDIIAGRGDDVVYGGDGDDDISGASGDDYLDGGSGSDRLYMADSQNRNTVLGGEGGSDFDQLLFYDYAATDGVSVTFDGDGSGSYDFVATDSDGIFAEFEHVQGTKRADTIDASADTAGTSIDGERGDDILTGGQGDDTIAGGSGNDTVQGGSGNDTLTGDAGNDSLVGGTGNDSLDGGTGNDTLNGDAGDDTLVGGAGNDVLTSGDGLDRIVLGDGFGADTITDFDLRIDLDETDWDELDVSAFTTGSGPGGALVFDDIVFGDDGAGNAMLTFPGGESVVLQGVAPSQLQNQSQAKSAGLPCFTPGTAIDTPVGPVPIERLRPGDLVCTRDDGPQPILWIGSSIVGFARLRAEPRLLPVRIAAGALGAHGAITVSPQHGLILCHGGEERMIRAAALARMRGGRARRALGCRQVRYLHLMLSRHQAVRAAGLWSETFYPGRWALAGLVPGARASILRLIPALGAQSVDHAYGGTVRAVVAGADLPPDLRALAAA